VKFNSLSRALLAQYGFNVRDFYIGNVGPFGLLNLILILVFSVTAANVFEHGESGSGRCVCVDVEDVSAVNLLEQSHGRVSLVILHHRGVALSLFNVFSWVLEDASSTIRALAWVLQEILTD